MKYTLSRTENMPLIKALHTICMPDDEFDLKGQLWVCYDGKQSPVAFCAARKLKGEPGVFFNRSGVLPSANGEGLQRRMIHARLRWAKEIGAKYALTYTMDHNHASIVNLLKCGFKFEDPAWQWAGNAHYFVKEL